MMGTAINMDSHVSTVMETKAKIRVSIAMGIVEIKTIVS